MVHKCRVLVQKTFGGLNQLQIELMIAHGKYLKSSCPFIYQEILLDTLVVIKPDFPKVTPAVQQFSRDTCIFDIAPKP